MPALDDLYGKGAAAALAATLDLTSIVPGVELVLQEGKGTSPATVQARWVIEEEDIGWMFTEFHGDWLLWGTLQFREGYQERGAFRHLIATERELFASWGIAHMVASPLDDEAAAALERFGYEWADWEGIQRLVCQVEGARMAEYHAWLRGGAEPAYHKALRCRS